MATTAEQVTQDLLGLPLEQRLKVLRKLLESLPTEELSPEWSAEVERRLENFEQHSLDFNTWYQQWCEDVSSPHS